MPDTIIPFTGATYGDIPVENVLNGALEQNLKHTLVIGYREDESLYFASSTGERPLMLWLLELIKQDILIWNTLTK